MIDIVLIAVSLSMDAFAVSVSSGICAPGAGRLIRLRAAAFFGFFQAAMPLAGWALASAFSAWIQSFDHWIAFGLLLFIGGKMAWEAARELWRERGKGPEAACDADSMRSGGILKLRSLTVLAVATSIDALAVGVSFSVLGGNVFLNAGVIGAITFVLCILGLSLGKRIGSRFGEWAEVGGGLVLIGIGVKILAEHLA